MLKYFLSVRLRRYEVCKKYWYAGGIEPYLKTRLNGDVWGILETLNVGISSIKNTELGKFTPAENYKY